jgi:amino acid transporter
MTLGTICFSVMISLGEIVRFKYDTRELLDAAQQVAYLPIPGGHIKLSERFVDPAFSFAMGWNYW